MVHLAEGLALQPLSEVEIVEALVRRHLDAVYRLSLAITGDPDDAADATQATCIAIWRHAGRLPPPDVFEIWLRRVAVNSCRMVLRSQRRRAMREIRFEPLFETLEPSIPTSRGRDAHEDAERLRAALRRLTIEQSAILALHHLEGRPVADIAAILGIPIGTAKSRLFHARAELRKALLEDA